MNKIIKFYYIIMIIFSLVIAENIYAYNSTYEETVNLPAYDANNTEMMLITQQSDWASINNPNIKYFYVQPGDYYNDNNNNVITLTQNGTATDKRYIMLYNGNNTHPGQLPQSQLARVKFVINADHWVLDRMSLWETPTAYLGSDAIKIENGSNNIINRYYGKNISTGIYIWPGSNNNTIQNSRIERDDITLDEDRAAFAVFTPVNGGDNLTISGTKIINNEVKNFVDAVQTVNINSTGLNYEGTIIDSNYFYTDNTMYTDCSGNHSPTGTCAMTENAVDLKVGSSNPNNPVIVSNNKFWGFRIADETNNQLSANGGAMVVHFEAKNIIVKNNLFEDSEQGISISNPISAGEVNNITIENNIFSNIKEYVVRAVNVKNIMIRENLIRDNQNSNNSNNNTFFVNVQGADRISFIDNTLINTLSKSKRVVSSTNLCAYQNQYFNSNLNWLTNNTDSALANDPSLNYGNFQFQTDVYSGAPQTITINNAEFIDLPDKNCQVGVSISAVSGNTTEAGGTATFTVVLDEEVPAGETVNLTGINSSDTTEGTVAPTSLTFTSANWNTPQTVTITGVDDNIVDGDISYNVTTTNNLVFWPANYINGGNNNSPNDINTLTLLNIDNDNATTPGITISTSNATTTEAGGTATFTVVLDSQPNADVNIGLSSSDTTEGTVAPTSLTFTSANWNTPQTVTITGVDDNIVDGDISYSIVTNQSTSTDTNYNGIDPVDVSVINTDNDVVQATGGGRSGVIKSRIRNNNNNNNNNNVINNLTAENSSNLKLSTSKDNAQNNNCVKLTGYYKIGDWNNEIREIQLFLQKEGFLKGDNLVYGYFGNETELAVKKFQAKYANEILKPWGLSNPTGYWYKTTQSKANKLIGCSKKEEKDTKINNLEITKEKCPLFDRYYWKGSRGEGVKKIQAFLKEQKFFDYEVTGYYDSNTTQAIKSFQFKYATEVLIPWGLREATGNWYQSTRAKANQIAGCSEGVVRLDNGTVVNY